MNDGYAGERARRRLRRYKEEALGWVLWKVESKRAIPMDGL